MSNPDFPMDLVFGQRYAVVCPNCGESAIDRYKKDDPEYYPMAASDHEAVTVHPDRDNYEPGNPLRSRGGWVQIDLFCPCSPDDVLVLAIGNHKGTEQLMVAYRKSGDE